MKALTKEAIERVLGPVDNSVAAELVATGATEGELRQAQAWLTNDEALINAMQPLPKGRVAELTEILRRHELPLDDEC